MRFDIQWSVATARQSTEWKGLAFRAMALALINMQERTLASQALQEPQAYSREGCQTSLASYKSTMNVKAAAGDSDIFYVIVRPALREQDANVLQEELTLLAGMLCALGSCGVRPCDALCSCSSAPLTLGLWTHAGLA